MTDTANVQHVRVFLPPFPFLFAADGGVRGVGTRLEGVVWRGVECEQKWMPAVRNGVPAQQSAGGGTSGMFLSRFL